MARAGVSDEERVWLLQDKDTSEAMQISRALEEAQAEKITRALKEREAEKVRASRQDQSESMTQSCSEPQGGTALTAFEVSDVLRDQSLKLTPLEIAQAIEKIQVVHIHANENGEVSYDSHEIVSDYESSAVHKALTALVNACDKADQYGEKHPELAAAVKTSISAGLEAAGIWGYARATAWGARLGGTCGSIIPGAGTAAGCLVGGAVGAAGYYVASKMFGASYMMAEDSLAEGARSYGRTPAEGEQYANGMRRTTRIVGETLVVKGVARDMNVLAGVAKGIPATTTSTGMSLQPANRNFKPTRPVNTTATTTSTAIPTSTTMTVMAANRNIPTAANSSRAWGQSSLDACSALGTRYTVNGAMNSLTVMNGLNTRMGISGSAGGASFSRGTQHIPADARAILETHYSRGGGGLSGSSKAAPAYKSNGVDRTLRTDKNIKAPRSNGTTTLSSTNRNTQDAGGIDRVRAFELKHNKKAVQNMTDTELAQSLADRAERRFPGTKGAVAGTKKHKYSEDLWDRYQEMVGDGPGRRPNLGAEVRYKGGKPWEPSMGLKNSIEIDFFNKTTNQSFDYKFGDAKVTSKQQMRYKAQLPEGAPSIIEIKPNKPSKQ